MTSTIRAVVAYGAHDLRLEERPAPVPGPGEVAVRIRYGGICGSDLHYWRHGAVGEFRLRERLVLGHEVVGHVLAAGAGSAPVGTPVAVHPATPCGRCRPCLSGRRNICANVRYLGSAAHFPHVQGGFADVIVVPAGQVLPLPPGLDLHRAAVAEPASVAWHAVRQAGDVRGKRVLVTGAGPIGCLVIAALRAAGAAEIVVSDLHAEPLQVATALGATETVLVGGSTGSGSTGSGSTGSGSEGSGSEGKPGADRLAELDADVAIESSGSRAGFNTCVHALARGGLLVGLGLLPPGDTPVAANTMITRELRFVGSFRFDEEMTEVLDVLAADRLRVAPVVTSTVPVDAMAEAFELAADPARSCKVLLDFGADSS